MTKKKLELCHKDIKELKNHMLLISYVVSFSVFFLITFIKYIDVLMVSKLTITLGAYMAGGFLCGGLFVYFITSLISGLMYYHFLINQKHKNILSLNKVK